MTSSDVGPLVAKEDRVLLLSRLLYCINMPVSVMHSANCPHSWLHVQMYVISTYGLGRNAPNEPALILILALSAFCFTLLTFKWEYRWVSWSSVRRNNVVPGYFENYFAYSYCVCGCGCGTLSTAVSVLCLRVWLDRLLNNRAERPSEPHS